MNSLVRLREAIAAQGLQAILINDLPSVAWLTGFSGTAGRVLVTQTDAVFLTDSRYAIQATEEVENMRSASFSTPVSGDEFLADHANQLGIRELGLDKNSIFFGQFESLAEKLQPIALVPIDSVVAKLRMIKAPSEVEKVKEACLFADRVFEYLLDRLQIGRTEFDIHLELEFYIRRHGYELAFPPIVVSGENSARPHGHASKRVLQDGDFVTMDFGATIDGYHSDITRTIVMGTATPRHHEVYDQVLKSQMAALEAIKPGVRAADVDALVRQVLDEKGLAQYFGHGLGHGLGRLVHDSGRMAGTSTDVFEPGQIWTVEPGVYIEGFGGVRIEDDVVVVEDGIEILTHSPKELLELPRR
jgi:Xaa-Pro aminopeptidase